MNIRVLVEPSHTAIVTQECQAGVIGEGASFRTLARAAAPVIPRLVELVLAARAAGVTVVHCLAWRRLDDRGSNVNCRVFEAVRAMDVDMQPGSDAARLLPGLDGEPGDLVLGRYHGVGPMGGTDLDAVLRNLGLTTIVGIGASVNLGITSLALDAVNAGYRVVLPRDAVVGVPASHTESMFEHVFPLVADITTCDNLIDAWR